MTLSHFDVLICRTQFRFLQNVDEIMFSFLSNLVVAIVVVVVVVDPKRIS